VTSVSPCTPQGLAYLLTFLFGANAVGLSALGVQLLLFPESVDAAQQVRRYHSTVAVTGMMNSKS
jgi:hypothetical protein